MSTNAIDRFSKSCAAFAGERLLAAGPLIEVALAAKNAVERDDAAILVFDDSTGGVIDLDLRGAKREVIARLAEDAPPATADEPEGEPRGRGRPRLGVTAREVTLLPRHWEWLAAQPGGASATLRRLVETARREGVEEGRRRAAQEAAYRFMSAMAGNLPSYEEAIRALFAHDRSGLEARMAGWPADIRDYALRLAASGGEG